MRKNSLEKSDMIGFSLMRIRGLIICSYYNEVERTHLKEVMRLVSTSESPA
jgi:hypothetical protein